MNDPLRKPSGRLPTNAQGQTLPGQLTQTAQSVQGGQAAISQALSAPPPPSTRKGYFLA